MSYRVIILADVHFSNRLPYSSGEVLPDGRTGRFVDQLRALNYVRTYANDSKVDRVFVLGDLFDKSSIDGFALFDVLDVLRGFKAPVCIIPGNHDAETVSGRRFGTRFLAAEEFRGAGIEYVEDPTVKRVRGGVSFHLAPYRALEQQRADLDALREGRDKNRGEVDVLLLHNSILGAEHYGWKCDRGLDPDLVCDGFDLVFAGHFHKPQPFGPGGSSGRIGRYVGGLIPLDFRDAFQVAGGEPVGLARGFTFAEFLPGSIRTEFEPVPAPKFFVAKTLGDLGDWRPAERDFLKIQVTATASEWIGLRPEIELAADELRSETGATVIVEHALAPEAEVRLKEATAGEISWERLLAEYVDATAGGELDPELLKEIGAEALAAAGG